MNVHRSLTFAYLLKRHRDSAGLTQEELAWQARLGTRTISNLERGVNKAPYRSTVRRLADALELSGEGRGEFQASALHPVEHSPRGDRTVIEGGFLGAVPTARLLAREEKIGGVLATTVRYDEALVALERAAKIHGVRNDPEATARVEATIAQTHFRRGTHYEGTARLSALLKSLDKPGATEGMRRGLAALYGTLARLYWARTRFAEAGTRPSGARASPAR